MIQTFTSKLLACFIIFQNQEEFARLWLDGYINFENGQILDNWSESEKLKITREKSHIRDRCQPFKNFVDEIFPNFFNYESEIVTYE